VAESRLRVGVVDRPISAAELAVDLVGDSHGATLMFEGTVRNRNRGRPVVRLHYEAYESMAEETLHAIAAEATDRFRVGAVAVLHRTGSLEIGDVSVAITVASEHRADAFEATRYVIEQVKLRLPVWKREEYADGSTAWLDGTPPEPAPSAGAGDEG
jgi:molybdopterin synthase catalytic subunit